MSNLVSTSQRSERCCHSIECRDCKDYRALTHEPWQHAPPLRWSVSFAWCAARFPSAGRQAGHIEVAQKLPCLVRPRPGSWNQAWVRRPGRASSPAPNSILRSRKMTGAAALPRGAVRRAATSTTVLDEEVKAVLALFQVFKHPMGINTLTKAKRKSANLVIRGAAPPRQFVTHPRLD
jgi:hypothetical protein